jgi:hypothetical protein
MRVLRLTTFLLVAIAATHAASAQSASDETLKSAWLAETNAYYARDMAAWRNGWLHDPNVTRTLIGVGSGDTVRGWDNVSAMAAKEVESNPAPIPVKVAFENFTSRQNGNLAWVEYDQTTSAPDGSQAARTREKRLLMSDRGNWRIASQGDRFKHIC